MDFDINSRNEFSASENEEQSPNLDKEFPKEE